MYPSTRTIIFVPPWPYVRRRLTGTASAHRCAPYDDGTRRRFSSRTRATAAREADRRRPAKDAPALRSLNHVLIGTRIKRCFGRNVSLLRLGLQKLNRIAPRDNFTDRPRRTRASFDTLIHPLFVKSQNTILLQGAQYTIKYLLGLSIIMNFKVEQKRVHV